MSTKSSPNRVVDVKTIDQIIKEAASFFKESKDATDSEFAAFLNTKKLLSNRSSYVSNSGNPFKKPVKSGVEGYAEVYWSINKDSLLKKNEGKKPADVKVSVLAKVVAKMNSDSEFLAKWKGEYDALIEKHNNWILENSKDRNDDTKVFNPESGKYVKKDSKKGKEILGLVKKRTPTKGKVDNSISVDEAEEEEEGVEFDE